MRGPVTIQHPVRRTSPRDPSRPHAKDLPLTSSLDPTRLPIDPSVDAPTGIDETDTPDPVVAPAADDDLLDIEDSTRLYLREISRVPLLTAEQEVMLAKTMEIGIRITSDPARAILDLHEWVANETEPKARAKHPQYQLPFGDIAARIVQSTVHVCFVHTNTIASVRFGFFFVQFICFMWLTGMIVVKVSGS